MHPTRRLRVLVDEQRCVGCGTCVVQAPKVFRLDARGKAEVMTPVQTWSPIAWRLRAQLPDLRDQRAPGGDGGVTSKMNTAAPFWRSGTKLRSGLR